MVYLNPPMAREIQMHKDKSQVINRIINFKCCSWRVNSNSCPPWNALGKPLQKSLLSKIGFVFFGEKTEEKIPDVDKDKEIPAGIQTIRANLVEHNLCLVFLVKIHINLFPGTNIRRLTHIPISNSAHVGAPEMPFAIDTCGERISRGCYLDRFSVLRYFLGFKNILKNISEKFPLFFSTLLNFPISGQKRKNGKRVKDHKLPVLIH